MWRSELRAAVGLDRRRGAAAPWPERFAGPLFERIFLQKNCNNVPQVLNRKNVYLAIVYNFHKGHLVFFSTDFAQQVCQL
jgi:hypothetical protein